MPSVASGTETGLKLDCSDTVWSDHLFLISYCLNMRSCYKGNNKWISVKCTK